MRLRLLLAIPIFSLIGLSIAIHQFGSQIIGFIWSPILYRFRFARRQVMWKCRRCSKPVYFAERKSSLGYDWHPQCLTCEECGKRLNPGLHAEHKGQPYCYIPCYGALFGPTLYGHGSRVESHASFGGRPAKSKGATDKKPDDGGDKLLEAKLKEYNKFYAGKSGVIHWRERNGKLILEGSLRIYWQVDDLIQLKEDHDDRLSARKNATRIRDRNLNSDLFYTNDVLDQLSASSSSSNSCDDLTDDCQSERNCRTLPKESGSRRQKKADDFAKFRSKSFDDEYVNQISNVKSSDELANSSPPPIRRQSNLRRSRVRLKRRCSINGHFYNRETSTFIPAPGSVTTVWITSLVNTPEVINLLLDKFKVTNKPEDFALFAIHDSGECKRIKENEFPLIQRVLLGPNEGAAKIFILQKNKREISSEVAQYLHFSNTELQTFLKKFEEEEIREVMRIKKKYENVKKWIKMRLNE